MDIFYAIAEPTRRSIIEMLAKKGRLSATDIGSQFRMSAPAISQHLKVLREVHLVQVEKQGQQRIYQLDIDTMQNIEEWSKKMSDLWNGRLDRLGKILEVNKKEIKNKNKNKNKYYGK